MGASDEEERDPDAPSFSLVTGKYRTVTRYHGKSLDNTVRDASAESSADTEAAPSEEETTQDLVLRSEGTVATLKDSAAGAFLQTRHWKGLEVRSGLDAPSVLEQGRGGIARGYGERSAIGEEGEREVNS